MEWWFLAGRRLKEGEKSEQLNGGISELVTKSHEVHIANLDQIREADERFEFYSVYQLDGGRGLAGQSTTFNWFAKIMAKYPANKFIFHGMLNAINWKTHPLLRGSSADVD